MHLTVGATAGWTRRPQVIASVMPNENVPIQMEGED
jgi:hypothetical protein